MKGAEAYVSEQWRTSGLANLPQGPESHCVTLHFIIPRDVQNTGLISRICEIAQEHLCEAYPGRQVTHEPITGSVIGDGTGEGVNLVYHIGPLE